MYRQNDNMYQRSNESSAKWFFLLIFVLFLMLLGAFAFGTNFSSQNNLQVINNLNKKITDQNSQILNLQAALQDWEIQARAEAWKKIAEGFTKLLEDFSKILTASGMVLSVSISLSLPVWAVSKSVAMYKLASAAARQSGPHQPPHHKPSLWAKKAREEERQKREEQSKQQKQPSHIEFLYTRPFWPENDKSEEKISDNHPFTK